MKFMMHEEKRRDTHLTPENRCHKRHHNFLASNSFHPSQPRPMHILICAYTYNVFIYYIYIYIHITKPKPTGQYRLLFQKLIHDFQFCTIRLPLQRLSNRH